MTRGTAAPAAPPRRAFALRDRTQLTFIGNVFVSAVSADGKQLAYITHNCGADGCSYAVDLQDVGGTATHRILDGATAGLRARVEPRPPQPDLRRHLGTVAGASTSSRRSAARPRFLSPGAAMFWAGGDSLLVGPPSAGADSAFQVRSPSIDGTVRDSIRVRRPGARPRRAQRVARRELDRGAGGPVGRAGSGRCSTAAARWPTR